MLRVVQGKQAKQAEPAELAEEARARLSAIGEIAAGVAHELRNVLQVISANAYLARQSAQSGGDAAPFLVKIEKNARVAQQIVDDLMALARGEPALAESVRIAQLTSSARDELELGVATFEDDLEDLEVRAHHGLCVRLFHVLYDNAIQASKPRPPRIVTRARIEDGRVVVRVIDDGPGVPADIRGTLFDPLVTRRGGGTGLGLALARRIAEAHGATLALEDAAAGATFVIRFAAR